MSIETVIASAFPSWALRRSRARALMRLYDAAGSSNYHKPLKGSGYSADSVMQHAGSKLRAWARFLDENSDLAIGIMDTMVNKIIGTGLIVEPMAATRSGQLHERVNNELRDLWFQFWRRPEVTRELPGAEVERQVCRSWLRDGEILIQHVMGLSNALQHPTDIAYSLELIEADYLPFDIVRGSRAVGGNSIVHGVEKNTWGEPKAFHLYKEHPGNVQVPFASYNIQTKRVSADNITHVKFTRRVKQTRGVPIIHGIIHRLDDIKDYEESERIAARVAASFTAFIRRGPDFQQEIAAATGSRSMEMSPGMIFDGLLPGEDVGSIGTDRPNTALQEFRNSQLRACAAGVGASYSSISKDYNGTYSAQRQELVESQPAYDRMRNYFIDVFMQPIWERFVMLATQTLVRVPSTVTQESLLMPDIRGTGMPWIDPQKEVEADGKAVAYGFESRQGVIRKRGGNPAVIDKQRESDAQPGESAQPQQQQSPQNPDQQQQADQNQEQVAA